MDEKKIKRINELYKKSKTTELTEAELQEQQTLRTEYRMAMLNSLSASLDNVSIQNPDGSITKVKPKGGN